VPVFVAKTRGLMQRLDAAAGSGAVVPLHELVTLLTMDIICALAFSQGGGVGGGGGGGRSGGGGEGRSWVQAWAGAARESPTAW
jgi:hypothetical protein